MQTTDGSNVEDMNEDHTNFRPLGLELANNTGRLGEYLRAHLKGFPDYQ